MNKKSPYGKGLAVVENTGFELSRFFRVFIGFFCG
ncbi:hypothetical protein ABID31_000055 [Chryseobacterium flavum]